MEACNYMNTQKRFLCFMVDHDGDVNVSYDFPQRTDDSCLGSAAVEIFIRIMQILHDAFPVLMKALYTDEAITDEQPSGRRGTITADPDQEGAEPEEDAEDETGSEGDRYPVRLQKMLMDRLSDDADDPSSAND